MTTSLLSDIGSHMQIPVRIGSSAETLDKLEDPFEQDDVEYKMDHEVERVLREWDTNKQRITHNSMRIRPTNVLSQSMSSSTPSSPFQSRRKRTSNSMTNLSVKDSAQRKHFEFPEINVSRREDSRLNGSADFETVTEDAKQPLYIHCPNSGQKLFKMEFDTEGYPHDNISVRVTGDKLVIHALQNETVEGRVSTTEFCRKVKLPRDVNSRRLECHVTPETGMLVITAPVMRSPASSSASSLSPHSPSSVRNELINTPFVRTSSIGKTMYLNAEVGRIFKSDDVTVKVVGQAKLVINAQRNESEGGNTLNAALSREFVLPNKIIPKTIQAGLTTDGILKIAAVVDCDEQVISNGKVHIEHISSENGNGKGPELSSHKK